MHFAQIKHCSKDHSHCFLQVSVCMCQIIFVSSHHSECKEVSSWHWVHVGTKGWPVVQEHLLGCSPQSEPGWEGSRYTHLLCRPDVNPHTDTLVFGWVLINVIMQIKRDARVQDSQQVWWCKMFQVLGCEGCGPEKVLSCYKLAQVLHHHVTGRWNRTPKHHWPVKDWSTWKGKEKSKYIHDSTAL